MTLLFISYGFETLFSSRENMADKKSRGFKRSRLQVMLKVNFYKSRRVKKKSELKGES
jgi:hypothetical protein